MIWGSVPAGPSVEPLLTIREKCVVQVLKGLCPIIYRGFALNLYTPH